jgi:hypothetical protein
MQQRLRVEVMVSFTPMVFSGIKMMDNCFRNSASTDFEARQ